MELKYINKYRNIFLGISLLMLAGYPGSRRVETTLYFKIRLLRLLGIISSLLPLLFHPYQGM